MKRSIRLRLSVLVACTFAVVLVCSSVLFLRWFERQLVDEVRVGDEIELARQVEIIDAIAAAAERIPEFLSAEDLLEPLADDDFPVAIIPDDGTIISITNADGVLLTDSTDSFRFLTSTEAADESAPDSDTGGLTDDEVLQAARQGADFVAAMRAELSDETLSEFALTVLLLEESFAADQVPTDDEAAAAAEMNAVINEMFFAFDEGAAGEGRVITTSREARILDVPVTVSATTRIDSIDAALADVTRTLWIAVPLLVALAAGSTFLATSRALRPVDAMTRRVEAITSARSGDRVPEPDTGDEINQLAVTMNGMLDRLETSAQSQRQFVSDVSHELRTPAAVIRAEIEAGLSEVDNDWPKTAESVLDEQVRLTALVDDLLLLARMDEGGATQRIDIDLDAVVQEEARRGWAHVVDVQAVDPVRIKGDERQLNRLVQNLVANANRHASSLVALTVRADGTDALLWVDDDGAGIPASERQRVFQRFARLDESRERDLGGSGLGLAIVKEVAEAHGGTATITNSPLGGARVEVRLQR